MYAKYTFGLIAIIGGIASVFANNSTQILKLTVPKVILVDIKPAMPFTFNTGVQTASGASVLSISSNDPDAKLQITPVGINLAVNSTALNCPTQATTSNITCHIGMQRIQGGKLAFNATRTGGEANIIYTIED